MIGSRLAVVDCVVACADKDCEGAGEAVRDLARDCCWKSLNFLLLIRFSNSFAKSVRSKLSVLEDPEGRCDRVAIVYVYVYLLCV